MHKSNLLHKTFAFCFGASISLTLLFFSYSHILKNQLAKEGTKILQDLEASTALSYKVIGDLNKQGFESCSDENLLQMRKVQFQSNDIRDVGFFDQDVLICTTGAGKLARPVQEGIPHDIFQGHKFWFGHELETFDRTIQGFLIRKDRYNIVLSLEGILYEYTKFNDYELVANTTNGWIHIYGASGLFANAPNNRTKRFETGLFSHSLTLCTSDQRFCLALQQTNFSEYRPDSILLSILLVILFSGMSTLYIYDLFFRYSRSAKRRIIAGIRSKSFTPYYQAIVELETGAVIGCELLARFKDKWGPLYPDKFIPLVSELNLSWSLTEQLILTALKDFKHIQDADTPFYLSINVFPKDINNQDILKGLALLKNLPPNLQVCFEVTEDEELYFNNAPENNVNKNLALDSTQNTDLAENKSQQSMVSNTLQILANSQIEISIDDFGTGYSNLSQLKRLDIDTLKIDKSFVDEVETGSIRSTLIPNIVSIADKLGANIIAEGVENKLQVNELLKMNIKYAQGWYYAKALPFKAFKEYALKNSAYRFK